MSGQRRAVVGLRWPAVAGGGDGAMGLWGYGLWAMWLWGSAEAGRGKRVRVYRVGVRVG